MSKPEDIIKRAEVLRAEISQIFLDADHWNEARTVFEKIDPDPDGTLKNLANKLDTMLDH